MKTEYLPDTNVLLRYLLNDHLELSQKASVFWEKVRTGERKAILPESVLMEVVYVLQRFYKIPREKIVLSLKAIIAYKGLSTEKLTLFDHALDIYGKSSLDFVDCLLAAMHIEGNGKLFSFDNRLNKLVKGEGSAEVQ